MDPESFDKIVSRIALAPSRRDALRGMGLGILSAVGGTAAGTALKAEIAEGKGKGNGKNRNKKNKGGDRNKGNGGNNHGGGDRDKGNGGGNDNHRDKNKSNGGGNKNKGNNKNTRDRDDADVDSEQKGAGGKCRKGKNCYSGVCEGSKKKRKKNKGRCGLSHVGQRCDSDSDCIPNSPCIGGICSFFS